MAVAMSKIRFDDAFKKLTGNPPFPWQRDLYETWFSQGKFPDACTLPTGLGKTSIVAVWLIALAVGHKVPRRLVYVVNRRTVVDQTTYEVKNYRENLVAADLSQPLRDLCAIELNKNDTGENESPLALSTLRGQFADKREWSADPCRPAVIVGTVDMIGSRLLFSGYGVGFKSKPLHAGFLGQDVLLVHDEAHLEPAFQKLIVAIRDEQRRELAPLGDRMRLNVIELTATSRSSGIVFPSEKEREANEKHPVVQKRVNAGKAIHLHENKDEKKLPDEIADLALRHDDSALSVLIFVRTVDCAKKVAEKLRKAKKRVETLTGTIRGKERDELILKPIFQRFLPYASILRTADSPGAVALSRRVMQGRTDF
jgi:CRISPR-associated endonuclease/helicase Cas3